MKNLLRYILLIVLVFNCDDDSKVQFNLKSLNHDYEAQIEVLYHQVEGKDINSNAINETIKKEFIKSFSDSEDVSSPNIESAVSAFDQEYKDFKSNFPDNEQVWQLLVETEITYISEEIISIALNTYIDTGGAHGNDSIIFMNFNPQTGELYAINDVVTDIDSLSKIAESYFKNEVMLLENNDSMEDYFFGESFKLPENIGFGEDGLIFLYNVYEIASYAEGYTEFQIPYNEINHLLKIH